MHLQAFPNFLSCGPIIISRIFKCKKQCLESYHLEPAMDQLPSAQVLENSKNLSHLKMCYLCTFVTIDLWNGKSLS